MSSATAAAGGTGNGGGGQSRNYNPYSSSSNSNNNNNNQFNYNTNANTAAAAASGGGEITAGYESSDDDGLHLTSSSFAPRDPKLDEEVNKHIQVTEPSWQVLIPSIKTGKQVVAEGNDDPNLTKWSKKYLPGVLDAVVKLQEHVVDTEHFDSIFCKLYAIIELAVQGRPCLDRKKNDDFLSSFRECNELILTVLTVFASLRGGLYFEREQTANQYGSVIDQFEFQLIGVNNLLFDCSPTALNDDPDEEQDAPVPAGAKSWKEYIATMIQLKQREFVHFHNELAFWSQRLKAVINYVDPCKSKEEKEILQLNNVKLGNKNKNNKSNNNNKDPTSVEAIRQDLAAYYNDVEFSMSQSSSASGENERCEQEGEKETAAGKFEDFFCNLRLKKRQQKEGEQQSVTDGEFVSASHLPTRLRSAAHTVLVTGPGGAGKTVALKHICIQQGVEDSVIVFVPLKELRGMHRRIKSIEDIFENCSASVALSDDQIEAIVEKRIPVIFAFDGFDEVHNAQEEDRNIAHFLSDMIDPKKRKFSLENKKLTKLVRGCDRVIISSREERIASANCNLDSAEARPLVDELAVQLWTNSEVERFCLRFFSNAFKKQEEQEQQNRKGEKELAKAVRAATDDVISSLASSPTMTYWRGLPLAVTLLSELRLNKIVALAGITQSKVYSDILRQRWELSKPRLADRLLRCKRQFGRKVSNIDLNDGLTELLFEFVINGAAEASFNQLLSTNSNVTEISFSSSSTSSSSSNKLPLWAALLRETGLIRVENNNSKATFSHRSWIEFLCARHAATSTQYAIEQIPWDQSKFASVWLLLADFAHSGTFEKSLSVQRFSFVVMRNLRNNVSRTFDDRIAQNRFYYFGDVDKENSKASISLVARVTNIVKPEELFSSLCAVVMETADFLHNSNGNSLEAELALRLKSIVKSEPDQLPKLIKRESVTCSKCKTHFSEAPADWKCNKCNVLMWNADTSICEICDKSFGLFTRRHHTRCCGKCVCSGCIFEEKKVPSRHYFCYKCLLLTKQIESLLDEKLDSEIVSFFPRKRDIFLECASSLNVLVTEATFDENDSRLEDHSSSQKQAMAANSFILHLRWLAELCVAEGALDCFKFIEEKYPEALFGVFKEKDLELASEILSPALARALDHLDRPSVSACVEYIINKHNVEVQLEDALRLNSLVGVTRAIKKMEKENFSLDSSVEKDVERSEKIMKLFSEAIAKSHFDVVAAMLRCRRDEKGRFLWFHEVFPLKLLQVIVTWLPQDLQFRVWCEEKKDFETSTLSDLAKVLGIDLSSDMKCEKFEVELSAAEQHLWIHFFHLFQEVVHHRSGTFSLTPSNSPGQLRVLDLWGNVNFTDEELAALVGKCTRLEEIDLSDTKFTDASLNALATCASTLRSLNLFGNKSCTDDGVVSLLSKCTRLEEINLSSTKFGDASLKALATCASTLRSLKLFGNKSCTDVGLAALVSKCTQLEAINLSSTKFGDASLKALATCASSLRSLKLYGNESCTDVGLAALVSKCTRLEEINLSDTKFADVSLKALATCASTLRSLNLCDNKSCTDAGLAALVSKCSKLERIILAGFDTVFGDASLKALATCASTLRSLNLGGNGSCTDAGLAALVSKCTQLEEVNLSDTKFGDASLRALAACGSTLRRLNLYNNKSCTDVGVAALVSKCTQLEEVNLSDTKFGDASLRALAPCGSTLRNLHLGWNKSCTDVGLAALVSKCTQLEEINLSGEYTKFGDPSLRALAASPSVTQQKPPTLVKINLVWNDNFTDAGIDVLKKAYGDFWNKVEVATSGCKNINK